METSRYVQQRNGYRLTEIKIFAFLSWAGKDKCSVFVPLLFWNVRDICGAVRIDVSQDT